MKHSVILSSILSLRDINAVYAAKKHADSLIVAFRDVVSGAILGTKTIKVKKLVLGSVCSGFGRSSKRARL